MNILLVDSDKQHETHEPATAAVMDAIQHAGQERGVQVTIHAAGLGELHGHVDSEVDGILLAPQVRHLMSTVTTSADTRTPVARITARDYSSADGRAILSTVFALVDHH
ncbi:hypothetical protein VMT65_24315 [Nocardia sp. CDC153]|uniref:hypothetical protein n=1 Tax=Nocardia sp. CDC153 TaxID=3112167 RepID=UPI002DB60F8D|nr:hypothetical protein [Nocardia sp. CDC153]MEC3956184.1 hypothetical protein [Nocardia sp. CDC153]